MSESIKRWRGLTALLADAVANGASSVERIHLSTARIPFRVLEQIPVVSGPAGVVDRLHGVTVAGVYGSVRIVTRVVAKVLDVALDAADSAPSSESSPHGHDYAGKTGSDRDPDPEPS
ncbi:MAG: hypothetical protein ABW321_04985 [Polyangiales bacterium]